MLGKTWGTQLQNESSLFSAILPEQILHFLEIFSLSQFGVFELPSFWLKP